MSDTESIINLNPVKYYTLRYIQEILEAFLAYSIYIYVKSNNFNIVSNIKISLFIGAITLFLEEYNPTYNKSIKSGMLVNLVSLFK